MEKSESMGFFNDYARSNNEMHPIAKLFYDASQECEKLPASEQQTATIIAIDECRKAVEQQLHLLSIMVEPITRYDNHADVEGVIDDFISDTNGEIESHFLASRLQEKFSIYNKPSPPSNKPLSKR